MSNHQASLTVSTNLPEFAERSAPLGPVSLIFGEDATAYTELLGRISAAVNPVDIFEEIWVRDMADLVWEGLRLRRLKASLMRAAAHQGLENILKPLVGPTDAAMLASNWASRDPDAIKEVEQIFASAGLTIDTVMAETLSIRLSDFERIDRMIAMVGVRRDAVLREVERHRAVFAQTLRRAGDNAEDAEFKVVDYDPATERNTP